MAQVLCPRTRQRDLRNSLQSVLVATILIFGFRCTGRGCGCRCGLSFIPRPNPQSQRNTRTPGSYARFVKLYLYKRKLLGRKNPWQDTYLMGTRSMHLGGYFIFQKKKNGETGADCQNMTSRFKVRMKFSSKNLRGAN